MGRTCEEVIYWRCFPYSRILKSFDVPLSVRRNGSLYLHVFLDSRTPSAAAKEPLDLISSSTATAHSVRLSRYAVPKPEAVSLIGGNGKEALSDEERSKAIRKRRKAPMGSQVDALDNVIVHVLSTKSIVQEVSLQICVV